MTVGDLANECGLSKHEACLIARDKIHAFERIHKGEAYGLTKTQIALLRPLFLAARPAPRAPMLPGIVPAEDMPMNDLVKIGEAMACVMNVQQVAGALGVDESTIRRHVRALFPGLASNGKTTYLDEAQATAIKQAIETSGRNDLGNVTQLQNVQTSLEIEEMTEKVISYHRAEAARLRAELAEQREALAFAAPKVEAFDRLLDASGTVCLTDAAKALGQSPKKFFDDCHALGVLFRRASQDWVPYQSYLDRGWFEVKTRTYGEGPYAHVTEQTRVTPKGLDGLAKLFPVVGQVSA
jgi:phage antirepressor YoqD-like protein